MKNRDLGFYYLGNGISVADKNSEVSGDFEFIAHINADRTIDFATEKLTIEDKQKIEHFAKTDNSKISATQDTPVFNTIAE